MRKLFAVFGLAIVVCGFFAWVVDRTFFPGTHAPAIQYGLEFNDRGSAMPKGGEPIEDSPYKHLFEKQSQPVDTFKVAAGW